MCHDRDIDIEEVERVEDPTYPHEVVFYFFCFLILPPPYASLSEFFSHKLATN